MPRERGSLAFVLRELARHPVRELLWKWNYKSAITSSALRGALFFVTNLSAGLEAAAGALGAELALRLTTAGFYGALTQALRRVDPPRTGTLGAMIILPCLAHGLELSVHWSRGTPNLALSLIVSMSLTAVTTAFNLFAMRHGALVVGERDSASLWTDLRRMPRLLWRFVLLLFTGARSCSSVWGTESGA